MTKAKNLKKKGETIIAQQVHEEGTHVAAFACRRKDTAIIRRMSSTFFATGLC
jgi:phosphoribosyl-ATP pyrophosphohydrolase